MARAGFSTVVIMDLMPALANGKICYIEIPATDIACSAEFYRIVFDWRIRQRGDGQTAFDDTTGAVSGTWVLSRPPAAVPGLLVYVMVDSVAAVLEQVVAHGGGIVQPIGADAPEITARISDPAGNVIGLYQEPKGQRRERSRTSKNQGCTLRATLIYRSK
ncbi:MAG: VOC family protein [Bryobacteraceae bacterium]